MARLHLLVRQPARNPRPGHADRPLRRAPDLARLDAADGAGASRLRAAGRGIVERHALPRPLGDRIRRHLYSRPAAAVGAIVGRSEEHTSELQSLMRISYAVFCLKKKKTARQ